MKKALRCLAVAAMLFGVGAPSQAQQLHGSIAFSQEDDGGYTWGIAWRFGSPVSATAESLAQCRREGGTNCNEVGWFRDACGALAIGDDNGYGAGWGHTKRQAAADALRRCKADNKNCRIEVVRCSDSKQAVGGKGRTEIKAEAKVRIEPKCRDLDRDRGYRWCFSELRQPPGCWTWVRGSRENNWDSTLTWSGPCHNGLAHGAGTLTTTGRYKYEDTMVNGKRHGPWKKNLARKPLPGQLFIPSTTNWVHGEPQ